MENKSHLKQAQQLMDDFALRTGLKESEGDPARRYLWTDAFAVHAFFGLLHSLKTDAYKHAALRLIELVHEHLGKFHPQDSRKGWISGLEEASGKTRPAIAGLRIGKRLPERQKDESYNSRLEWERDGQYFHYISRWMNALMQAHQETDDETHLLNAQDLFLSTEKFIYGSGAAFAMYWKMTTRLTHPLVPSMGAHDPLEGLLCGLSLKNAIFEKDQEIDALIKKYELMCSGKSWTTSDALGIGGLLLNAVRAAQLEYAGMELPPSARSNKLIRESLDSLNGLQGFEKEEDPNRRLPFRECGLSLGLRVAKASGNIIFNISVFGNWEDYFNLASKIEDFWLSEEHQNAATWQEHPDINAVSLAASVIACEEPGPFSSK